MQPNVTLPLNATEIDVKEMLEQHGQVLSGNVSFGASNTDSGKNLDCYYVDVNFPVGNTNLVIDHRLGRVPVGYVVVDRTAAGIVYNGTGGTAAWTKSTITLRSSVIMDCRLLLF